ncbi:MAG: fructose PTS transporter subunit IIA, partial [Enterococcus thailandicus]|nr:fructose PTS transporter subunit IIA [Enterococcus thailandicus]
TIVLDTTETTKDTVVEDLVQRLGKTGHITDTAGFKKAIYTRENESTTGIGMGIAIPHGKSAHVTKPTLAFARSQQGIDWQSLDGEPAHLIFMIAVPENSQGDMHLKILQRLSRKLMDDDFRQALMEAPNKAAVNQLLSEM